MINHAHALLARGFFVSDKKNAVDLRCRRKEIHAKKQGQSSGENLSCFKQMRIAAA